MRFDNFLELINNPTSRYFLRKICNKKTKLGSNLLEQYLFCYFNNTVTDDMKSFFEYKTRISNFGISTIEKMVFGKRMKINYNKRGAAKLIVTVIKSIAKYGLQTPFVSINPISVHWNITNKCNLKCVHCYQNSSSTNKDELSLEEKFDVIDQLVEAGCIYVTFSGGEPLLSKDFFKVLGYAHSKGMIPRVLTNGTLITKDVAKRFANMDVDLVSISLDGIKSKTHKSIRISPDSHERTISGIKNCIDEKITMVAVSPTLTSYNYKEIEEIINFSKNLGIKHFFINDFVPFGRGRKKPQLALSPKIKYDVLKLLARIALEEDLLIVLEPPQFTWILRDIAKELSKSDMATNTNMGVMNKPELDIAFLSSGCYCGRVGFVLDPNGDIKPCQLMNIVVGNTKKDKIKDVWRNSEVFKRLRKRENLKGSCRSCKNIKICGGCRSQALYYFQDLMAPDPTCVKNIELWNRIKDRNE